MNAPIPLPFKTVWITLCFILIGINLAYAIAGVARYGAHHIDAYGIWLLKAKAFRTENGVPLRLLTQPEYSYSHPQYPLLLPALMSWWWDAAGSETAVLWWYPVSYVAVIVMMYGLLKQDGLDAPTALGWTAAASFLSPFIAQAGRQHAGLADMWIALLVGAAVYLSRRLADSGNRKYGWLLVLVVALASQIKLEGLFLIAFLMTARVPWQVKGLWLTVAGLPALLWQVIRVEWGISGDFGWMVPGLTIMVQRLVTTLRLVFREMLNIRNWYVVWPLFWLALAGWGEKRTWWIRTGWGTLGLMTLGFTGVYLFSSLDTAAYVASSIDRVMLQLLPLWWVGMAGRSRLAIK